MESLFKNFNTLKNDIKQVNLDDSNTPLADIFTDYFDDGNFSDEIRGKFFNDDGTPRMKDGKLKPSTVEKVLISS